MRSFLQNKNSGLILRAAIIGCALAAGLLGWQLGAGSHSTAAVVPLSSKPAQQQKNKAGHAPALPLETSSLPAAPVEPPYQPVHKPLEDQEHSRRAPDTTKAAENAKEQVVAVDPAQSANWMLAGGQYVSVQGYVPETGGRGIALDVLITPTAAASSGATTQASTNATTSTDAASSAATGRLTTGFTYEEELFRSKWGWAAYEAAQRAGNGLQ